MSCLLTILFASSIVFAQEIKTSGDFKKYTSLHIQRVQKLGQELRTKFPKQFGTLDPSLVENFLSLHDQSKMKPDTLKALTQFYGRSQDSLSETDKNALSKLKNQLNQKDLELRMRFLDQKGLIDKRGKLTIHAKKLLFLERIADLVDRGSSFESPKEFGRTVAPASNYLKAPLSKKMATTLETVYPNVTKGMSYKETFVKFGSTAATVTRKTVSIFGKAIAAPLTIFGELFDPNISLASDEEEFELFYKRHPEYTPHTKVFPQSAK